ncbi:hypothetical protein BS47DRAFT_1338465 [Hydnum rufescens UP504]|uniref:Uncharacterized protein n=1 Tax=Hydnum rufescens UP504 TaxID=1448309 RepID=A0A9P6B6I8_9AGAM|nr:hypothetical protein BS47DRAFT_1338465 [Hydnum rufescens UP504]
MTTLANAGSEGTLATEKGHHFASMASFPWRDPVNGPRVQDSEIIVALQSKELGRHKYIAIEGKIELNSHLHTSAQRFKLDSFEITVSALHGNSNLPTQFSVIRCPLVLVRIPSPPILLLRERSGSSELITQPKRPLVAFLAPLQPDLSIAARCMLTVRIVYPDWPTLDESSFAGEMIHTTYDTNFAGSEVKGIATVKDVWNTNKLPQGISYTMEVNRRRNSGFGGKIVGTVNTIGRTLKILGKQARRPSRVLDMMYDRSEDSNAYPRQ